VTVLWLLGRVRDNNTAYCVTVLWLLGRVRDNNILETPIDLKVTRVDISRFFEVTCARKCRLL
jgi:hypothetical protein